MSKNRNSRKPLLTKHTNLTPMNKKTLKR